MSELTNNQMLALELRKIANLIERIPLHTTVRVDIHGVSERSRQDLMELFGGKKAFEQKGSGSCVWHETEYLCGDMELTLHHTKEVAV
ncbi:hypothetical protein SH449x_004081 [Pirellulaceae bacterium SH449]